MDLLSGGILCCPLYSKRFATLSIFAIFLVIFSIGDCKGTQGVIYNARLLEEQPLNTVIFDLKAKLRDSTGIWPGIGFKLLEQKLQLATSAAQTDRWVRLSSDGKVIQDSRVDRETLCGDAGNCFIQLKVVTLPQPEHLILYTIYLHIMDINDNFPNFPSSVIDLKVTETQSIGYAIDLEKYRATDLDAGNNSVISYSLSAGKRGAFRLETNPRLRLVLQENLDYETAQVHRFTLNAEDHGETPRKSSVSIRVHVSDENNHAPVFEQKEYNSPPLRESSAPGTFVAQVKAEDRDSGPKGNVRYSIGSNSGSSQPWPVTIDSSTGYIALSETLDLKKHDGMKILIKATDEDDQKPQTATALLLLHVVDVNDHAPEISVSFIEENWNGNTGNAPP